MNIFVCIKQVPATNKVQVDEKTGVLKRSGVMSKMNPYDLYALETALRLKEKHGGKVTVGTMGPPQAQAIIREAYMMGADEGYVFSDRRLGGADVLATSYTLSQAIQSVGDFDLILCGKQTTDGDTAQVGPAVSERLGVPAIANVLEFLEIGEKDLTVKMDLGDRVLTAKIPYPCLVGVDKDLFTPRLPSYLRMKATADREVKMLGFADLDADETKVGSAGSPTQVRRIFPPEGRGETQFCRGTAEELADAVLKKLADARLF